MVEDIYCELSLTPISGNLDARNVTGSFDGSGDGLVGGKAEDGVDDGGAEKHIEYSDEVGVWDEELDRWLVFGDEVEKLWMMMDVGAANSSFLYLIFASQRTIVAASEHGECRESFVHEAATRCMSEAWLHIPTTRPCTNRA
jgi:hypothetical protein